MPTIARLGAVALTLLLAAQPATQQAQAADLIVSMNDNHTVLDANGNQVAAEPMRPDTADIIDVGQTPPRVVETFEVPGSVVGPPFAVWVSPDFTWAILTSATKADPAAKFGIGPDDRVSVVDLTSKPPRVTQTLAAGAGATTIRLSPDRRLALVANRTEGSVSIFTVAGQQLTPAGKLDLGKQSGPSGLAFSKDGRTVLVSRQFDHQVSVLHVDGTTVTLDKRLITTALGPYTMDINADQTLVAVSNMGRADGDVDSVSLIDLTRNPPAAVSITGVASGPEPLKFSPDGKFLAVGAEMGTPLATTARFYHVHGLLQVFAVDGATLTLLATGPIGRWVEGIAWSRDGRTLLVQNDRDRTISVFGFDGHTLTAKPDLIPTGGPAAFGVPWP
jgi:DNA-binding beta-propeller fold protein YncE